MGNRQADQMLRGLNSLVESEAAQLPDGQLLRRFASHRDEGAFAALLKRHGPLVYGVCRNVLRHEHDAEDAFQATFLVLARRAPAIRAERALPSWLYRVAYRVSMKARTAGERRRKREDRAAKSPEDRPVGDLAWRELQAMLDEELNRLPEKLRAPFVLCCLTGKSKSEAAADLGWKEGTVSSRLAKAREVLQRRLARRGVTLSALLSGLAIADPTSAVVPATLLTATRQAALAFAAGGRLTATVASIPAALARSILRGMTAARLKVPAALLLVLGLAGTTALMVAGGLPEPAAPPILGPPPEPATEPAQAAVKPVPGAQMVVTGRVGGPFNQALPAADIAVVVSGPPKPDEVYGPDRFQTQLLGRGRTDETGRFELSVLQTTHSYRRLRVWAYAPGHGPHTRSVDPTAITNPRHDFDGKMGLQLIPGRTVRGRLLDPDARPAPRVPVYVLGMVNVDGPQRYSVIHYEPPLHLPGWPRDIVTDDNGVFTLRDVGINTKVLLQVRDQRYATNWFHVQAGEKDQPTAVDIPLLPPRILAGRLTAEDTGQPLADAEVVVETMIPNPPPAYGVLPGYVTARTDENGEFRVRPFPGERLEVFAYPPAGQPYLAVRHYMRWPAGATEHRFDLPVSRGVRVRGKVQEAGTDQPVAGAALTFEWGYRNNPYRASARPDLEWRHRNARTGADGTFAVTVPPGPGLLMVKAADPDFVRVETSSRQAEGGKGGKPYFPDAFVPLDLKPGDAPPHLAVRLCRGLVVRGRVVASDGTPVRSALLFTPKYMPDGVEFKGRHLVVRDGRFELPGCDPDGKVSVWVYDPQKKEGGYAEFVAADGADPVVRLSPCVSGTARVTDQAGKPARDAILNFDLVLRPGDDIGPSAALGTPARLAVPELAVYSQEREPKNAGDGTFRLRDLIPGATYGIRARTASTFTERVEFTAPASGVHDVGTLVLGSLGPAKRPPAPPRTRQPYIYEPKAVDPDGDPVTFDLVEGPAGMTFDPQTGVLFWLPGPDQVGKHNVLLRASDPYGGTATQKWQINVAPLPPEPPPKNKKD